METILNTTIYDAAAYFRLSREDGDKEESDSIVNQKALIKEFLKANPDIVLFEEKVDDGYTGVNFERPAFQEMMESIKSGKVNCVIVKDLSRFGRNYIEAGRYIEKIFPYLGVRFIAINDNIDTAKQNNSSQEMIIPFKNLINDAYCRDISIKVRSHLDIKRKRGEYIGAFAPYGYKKSEEDKNQLVVDEQAAAIIKQMFKWKIEGMSGARIAVKLNELGIPTPMKYKHSKGEKYQSGFRRKVNARWEANVVNQILRNETYTGVLLQGKTSSPNYKIRNRSKKDKKDWIRCEESHEPIISKEIFQLVHGLFQEDTRVSPDEQTLHLFSGIVKCGYCKGNMTRKTVPIDDKKYIYLVCMENKKSKGKACRNKDNISLPKFEKAVLAVINMHIEEVIRLEEMSQLIENIPYKGYLSEKLSQTQRDKEHELEKIREYEFGLYQDYKENILSKEDYQELKLQYKNKTSLLMKEIISLENEKEEIAKTKAGKLEWIKEIVRHRGFQELSRELLLQLVEEITVYSKERIEITFRFQEEFANTKKYIEETIQVTLEQGVQTKGAQMHG